MGDACCSYCSFCSFLFDHIVHFLIYYKNEAFNRLSQCESKTNNDWECIHGHSREIKFFSLFFISRLCTWTYTKLTLSFSGGTGGLRSCSGGIGSTQLEASWEPSVALEPLEMHRCPLKPLRRNRGLQSCSGGIGSPRLEASREPSLAPEPLEMHRRPPVNLLGGIGWLHSLSGCITTIKTRVHDSGSYAH